MRLRELQKRLRLLQSACFDAPDRAVDALVRNGKGNIDGMGASEARNQFPEGRDECKQVRYEDWTFLHIDDPVRPLFLEAEYRPAAPPQAVQACPATAVWRR